MLRKSGDTKSFPILSRHWPGFGPVLRYQPIEHPAGDLR